MPTEEQYRAAGRLTNPNAGGDCPAAICSAIDGVKLSHEHGHLCFRTEKGWLLWSCKLEDMSENGESLESIINDFSPQNDSDHPPRP